MCFVCVVVNNKTYELSSPRSSAAIKKPVKHFVSCQNHHPTMDNEPIEADNLKLVPCSFKFHNFVAQVGEVRISCRIIKMEDSLYLWIGDFNDTKMTDLTVAMISRYEKLPVATKLMGQTDDSTSTSLAKRLARKCGKPVYVSFNMTVNNVTLPGIEKAVQTELNAQKDLLSF